MKQGIVLLTGILFFFCQLVNLAVAAQTEFSSLARQKAEQSVQGVYQGEDGWLFLKEELSHIAAGKFWGAEAEKASRTSKKEYADPLPAIVDYSEKLQEKGITLYLVCVPPKALVYPEYLDAGLSDEKVKDDREIYARFYDELAAAGVQVIDLIPEFIAAKKRGQQLYCKTDSHYSGAGLAILADAMARKVRAEGWYDEMAASADAFTRDKRKISITGDLAVMLGNNQQQEEVALDFVKVVKASSPALWPESPVILMGDSHTLVFSSGGDLHAQNAGLAENLAAELGFGVDLLGVRGSGVTPARIKLYQRSKKNPQYLQNKKVLFWCFTAREITGMGGWKKIPVAP